MTARATLLGSLALVAAVALVYGRVAGHEFVAYDTSVYLTNNPRVLAGPTSESLRWALTEAHGANWHPLTWWSHMLDVALFGLEPAGHHLENVAWHAANAVLFFLAFARATGRPGPAFAAALVWAVHPLRAESVAWVVERKDVLSTFFGLVSIHAWLAWGSRGGAARYAASLGALALGLLAKPMLVTWPFVLLLLDVWPLARTSSGWRRLALEKLPFLFLAAASSAATVWAQRAGAAVQPLDQLPLTTRAANAAVAVVEYLRQTVAPYDLCFYHPHPGARSAVAVALALLVVAAASALAWRARRAHPALLVGWLWYLGTYV